MHKSKNKPVAAKASTSSCFPKINTSTLRDLERSVPADVLERLFFPSASKESLRNHATERPEEFKSAKPTSFKLINQPNGGGWKPSEVPAVNKSSCTYASQFQELPLDGAQVNRDLGKVFAQNANTGMQARTNQAKMSDETTNRVNYTKKERGNQLGACRPLCHVSTDPTAKFYESKTCFQRNFMPMSDTMLKIAQSDRAREAPCSYQRPSAALVSYSSYERDFRKDGSDTKGGRGMSSVRPSQVQSMPRLFK